MCVIVIGEIEKIRESLPLAKAWEANPHGAGIVIPGKEPLCMKGIMTFEALKRALSLIPSGTSLALHFRFATHGSITADNTHPFRVDKSTFLMHNGCLEGMGTLGNGGESDSAHLARILKRLGQADREALCESLPGRFALIKGSEIVMCGAWDRKTIPGLVLSNSFFLIEPRAEIQPPRRALPTIPLMLPTLKHEGPTSESESDDAIFNDMGIPRTAWEAD